MVWSTSLICAENSALASLLARPLILLRMAAFNWLSVVKIGTREVIKQLMVAVYNGEVERLTVYRKTMISQFDHIVPFLKKFLLIL